MTNKEGVVNAPADNQTALVHTTENTGNAEFLKAARNGKLEEVLECLKRNIDINTNNACGLNALHLASKEGHVNVVVELLKRGANVNAATKKGNTALHIASLAGREEVVKILVRNGANVNVQSQNGFTPLYMAAQENHDSVVKFLLSNGANQSLSTEDGFTPLAVALQQGHDKVVAVLLENDAKGRVRLPALHIAAKKDDCKAAALLLQNDHDPDVTSKSGFTPLHIAAHYGNENIATLLLDKNADVNFSAKHQITPLHVASKWGKSNMVTLLLDRGGKIDASTRDGLTPLHCAARSGHDQVVDLLLEQGAPITAKTKNGLAPLHMASQGDHVDCARILLYHKAPVDDVTVDYLTALHVAAHCGHVRVAKLLLDRKADPNARALNGFTPLHIACKKNRIKVVELLLKHGASIEATTESGLTPLHVASFMGCMNIVIYLIQHGANPDVPTVRGETPLHLAARAKQADIIRILLRNGAHVDAAAREQQTPLHIAARLGNVDIVGLLLQHGATVDATTKDMYTALHIAAKEGQEEVASVLLDHGASLTATTKKGFTPLHLAAKYGNIRVARLLLQKDAPVDSQGKNGVTPLHVAAHYDHVNVALLLLDKGAYPHATAKNGYTPLHIAAKKNQMDIATTLLEYGAKPNAESKAGFTPLHLAAQEGHTDMTTLLIEHHANVNSSAKNGLTPLHLCAQEDRVNVAAILVKNGSDIGPQTKVGYTPLHVACHFGQINMIRFLLQHGADVNATTSHGYTPLHQAAQQGHTLIINLLLEHKASPNNVTSLGQTALSIAQRLGYVSVVETLKIVTETVVTTTTTTVTEEKYKVVAPETMQETFMSDSEDEGDDIEDASLYGKPAHATHVYLPYIEGQRLLQTEDTTLADQSFRYLTADEMKSLGDDSLPIDVTGDERGVDISTLSAPTAEEDHLTPQHYSHQDEFSSAQADNVELSRAPIHAGFLVSFMVDARGGAMRGCRHSGVRVIIPPRKAPMPMRITCRYLRKEKLAYPPPLMEGEACASRILEVGPAGAKFLGPVIIEVPHFASLRGREREIMILRSDNGETWREHTLEASDDAVHDVFNESFEGDELNALDDLNTNRITRILTTDFPQYFAIVTRIRQEVHAIGSEGGMVSSTVVPQVQAIFSEGALTKKIKVGLQAQPIPPELVAKLLGNRVAVSPIVTVEPRRRKFHKPITLTIPVPQAAMKGMINQYTSDASTLRLLCSITGGTTKAQWEDVTGSTPLTLVNDCVSFTTTVSARFWLMDCRQVNEATKYATELYREAIHVPFMAKFVVFAKRHDPVEAQLRVFCMTDDKEDKTLESQEHFTEVAKSRDVEVLEAKDQYLEFAGNLIPVTKSGEQLSLTFQAFRENRLPFTIRVKDPHQEPLGRIAFMREPRVGRGEPPQHPICNLNIVLPETQLTPVSELISLEKKYGFMDESGFANPDLIHRADLRLTDIAKELKDDWVPLALQLDVPESDINSIRSECPDSVNQQAIVMLRHWLQRSGAKATGNSLEKGLRKINREDIVNKCMFNVELVTDDVEKAVAKVHLDQSGFDTFKEELGSSREASLKRDSSLNGILDDRDFMKEAESAAETSSESSEKETHLKGDVQDEQTEEVCEEAFIKEAVTSPESTYIGEDSGIPDKEEKEFVQKTTTSYIVEPGNDEYVKSETITTTVHSDTRVEVDVVPEHHNEEDYTEKEFTEYDESGGIKQVTKVKTETSVKVVEETTAIIDFQKETAMADDALLLTDDKKISSGKPPSDLALQLDISAVVKSQILKEEIGQEIEDSPLEVKYIGEEIEKQMEAKRETEMYSHIKTEIISQQLGEDIEYCSPEKKTISPLTPEPEGESFSKLGLSSEAIVQQIEKQQQEDEDISEDRDVSLEPEVSSTGLSEHIEYDDLKEYEEAKEEHSLTEQLRALAANVSPSIHAIEQESFAEFGAIEMAPDSSHMRNSTWSGKKEIRSLKSTKQVSTIEEYSSLESSDSPLDLQGTSFEFSQKTEDLSFPAKQSLSLTASAIDEQEQCLADSPKITASECSIPEKDISQEIEDTSEAKDSSEEKPSDDSPPITKHPSPPSDKSSKHDKKSDSDSDDKKFPGSSELKAPSKKDSSFSSSGEIESHYYSVETSDSGGKSRHSTPAGSRPCSSEFEVNVLSGQASEYETCATSQETTGEISGSYATAATSSQETSYSTACSSLSHSSRESAYSVDSESSGNLASVEVSSEASETLVPSAQEIEMEFGTDFEMPVLDEESSNLLKEPYDIQIPESVIRGGIELPFMPGWDRPALEIQQSDEVDSFTPAECYQTSAADEVFSEHLINFAGGSQSQPKESIDDSFSLRPYHTSSSLESTDLESCSKSPDKPCDESACPSFLSETEGFRPSSGKSTEDVTEVCAVDDQLSASDSVTQSEQTWQTSSMDTAVHVSVPGSSSSLIQPSPNAIYESSHSDEQVEVGIPMVEQVQPEPYLQLNGPVEVEYNADYDGFNNYEDGLAEDQNPVDELQFELEEHVGAAVHAVNGNVPDIIPVAHGGDESIHFSINGAQSGALDSDIPSASCLHSVSQISNEFAEAEQPEAQQQLPTDEEEHSGGATSSRSLYQTSFLPESDQCSMTSHTAARTVDQTSIVVEEAVSNTVGAAEQLAESQVKVLSSSSVDVVDTSPEDERYEKQVASHGDEEESPIRDMTSVIRELGAEQILIPSITGISAEIVPQTEEEDFELKESDMFPSLLPEDDKLSTPSFEGRKGFPHSGETSAASSLQEFERLEAELAASKSSEASLDSYKMGKSGHVQRFMHSSAEASAASSLQEFERLEAELAASKSSEASLDSYKMGKGSHVQRLVHSSAEASAASSLQEFERLEAEIVSGTVGHVSADSCRTVDKTGQESLLKDTISESDPEKELCDVIGEIPDVTAISRASDAYDIPISETSDLQLHSGDIESSVHDHGSDDSDYEKRMTEMEEIIKIAESNVEKFHEEVVQELPDATEFEGHKTSGADSHGAEQINDQCSDFKVCEEIKTSNLIGILEADGTEAHDSSSNSSKNGKGDCMISSTDSVDPSSSTATHATYQYETDSVMSSSINSTQASNEEYTVVSSTDSIEPETKITYVQGDIAGDESCEIAGKILESTCIEVGSSDPAVAAEEWVHRQDSEFSSIHRSLFSSYPESLPQDESLLLSSDFLLTKLEDSSVGQTDHRIGLPGS